MRVVKTILSLAVLGAVAYVVVLILHQAERRRIHGANGATDATRSAAPEPQNEPLRIADLERRSADTLRVDQADSPRREMEDGRGGTTSVGSSLAALPRQTGDSASPTTEAGGDGRSGKGVSEPAARPGTGENSVSPTGRVVADGLAQPSASQSPTLSRSAFEHRLQAAETLAAEDKIEEAHQLLSQLYWEGRLPPLERAQLIEKLTELADRLYFSRAHRLEPPYVVQPGDSLARIGKHYGVSWEFLARTNGIGDPKRIRAGQRLKVVRGPFGAVVDLSDFELTVHLDGRFVRRYDVGIGKDGTTPIGTFSVREKQPNPKYWGDPVREADDPENPLGEHWIGIGNSYGLHGTIEPESIRRRESAGCIRLLAVDVAELYDLLVVGSEVRIQR